MFSAAEVLSGRHEPLTELASLGALAEGPVAPPERAGSCSSVSGRGAKSAPVHVLAACQVVLRLAKLSSVRASAVPYCSVDGGLGGFVFQQQDRVMPPGTGLHRCIQRIALPITVYDEAIQVPPRAEVQYLPPVSAMPLHITSFHTPAIEVSHELNSLRAEGLHREYNTFGCDGDSW